MLPLAVSRTRCHALDWGLCNLICESLVVCSADFGVEHSILLTGKDAGGVNKALEELVQKGESMPRYHILHLVAYRYDSCWHP